MTLQLFGSDGFSIIITFCMLGDFFCSHVSNRARLTSDSDLTNGVCL